MAFDFTKKIGKLWVKISKKQSKYLNGGILVDGKRVKFGAFINTRKESDDDADYIVYPTIDSGWTPTQAEPKPAIAAEPKKDEDLPF